MLLFLAVLAAMALAWLDTPAGQNWLIARLNRSLAAEGVEISGLQGRLLGGWELESLSLSDAQGRYLTLRQIELAWRPLALFRGEIAIDKFAVGSAELSRLPDQDAKSASPGSDAALPQLPQLPVRVRLARFEVESFVLGEPVVGLAARLTAAGEVRWLEDGRLLADIRLARLDVPGDLLMAELEYDQPAQTLSLNADLAGAAGGLFATALGGRTEEDVFLSLNGDGPLTAWRGRMEAGMGDRARLAADIKTDSESITFAGEAEFSGLLQTPYAALAKPAVGFRMTMGVERETGVPVVLSLDTEALSLTSEAMLALEEATVLDASYRLDIMDGQALSPLLGGAHFASGTFAGRASGPLGALAVTARAEVNAPEMPELAFAQAAELQLTARLGGADIPIALEGRIAELRMKGQPPLDPEFMVSARYRTADGGFAVESSRVSAGGATVSASGRLEHGFATVTLEGDIVVAALDGLAFVQEMPIAGGMAARYRLVKQGKSVPWTIELDAAGERIAASSDMLTQLLGPRPEVTLRAEFAENTRLRLAPIRLQGAAADLEASGTIDLAASQIEMTYDLAVARLSELLEAQKIAGTDELALTGRLFGTFSDLKGEGQTRIAHLELQGIDLVDVTARLSARDLTERPEADLNLRADSRFGAAQVTVAATLPEGGGVDFPNILMTVGTAEINGALQIGSDGLLRGAFEGGTGSLAELPESRRFGLRGNLSLAVELSATEAGPQKIIATAHAADLIVPMGGTQIAEIESFDFSGDATLLAPRPTLEARLEAKDARWGFSRLADLTLTASGTRESMELRGTAAGEWRGPLELEGRLVWSGLESFQQVTLGAEGTLFGQRVALAEPAHLLFSEERWRLEPLRFTIGEGRLSLAASRRVGEMELTASAESLPLELVNVVLPDIYPGGRLNGELTLSQLGETVTGRTSLSLRDVEPAVAGFARTPPFGFDLEARLAGDALVLEGDARAMDALEARLSAELPLELDPLAGTVSLRRNDPMTGRFRWEGALAPLFMVVNLPQHEALGDFSADLSLGGTPSVPRLAGDIAIVDGRYEHLPSGFIARDLKLLAELEDRQVTVTDLTAEDGEGGSLSGSGRVEFTPDAVLAEAKLSLEDLRVLRRSDLKAMTSGQVAFVKTAETMTASGRIEPGRVEIDIGSELPQNVADLEVIEVEVEQEAGVAQTRGRADPSQPLQLDLAINAPRRLFVRGRGLDSEWSANLRVTGTADAPRLQGSASIVKGVFEFAGQRFILDTGELLFPGGEEIDPLLNLTARETVEDLQITLQVTGTLSAPQLSLSSTPSLPEDEILARVLFGESISDLSALQLVQLASAVGGLSGGGGFDVIGGARGLLGLDRLNITARDGGAEGEGGPTISGGKYLTDNVYLEMSTETGTGVTAGTLEWSLTKNLSLESRVSSGRDNSIRMRWSWNY